MPTSTSWKIFYYNKTNRNIIPALKIRLSLAPEADIKRQYCSLHLRGYSRWDDITRIQICEICRFSLDGDAMVCCPCHRQLIKMDGRQTELWRHAWWVNDSCQRLLICQYGGDLETNTYLNNLFGLKAFSHTARREYRMRKCERKSWQIYHNINIHTERDHASILLN